MFIKIEGIEPQFKVYKMSENIKGKIYIGKTKLPLKDRMKGHRYSQLYADKHFSDVGWNNVTVEIIDTANSDEELSRKENLKISEYYKDNPNIILNKNSLPWFEEIKKIKIDENFQTKRAQLGEQNIDYNFFTSEHWFKCQRKIYMYHHDIFSFIKSNKYIIKNVCGAREYVGKCVGRFKQNKLTNDEVITLIIQFLKDKPWRGKCEINSRWKKSLKSKHL